MLYTERSQLAIIQLKRGQEKVSLEEIKRVLLKYHSNMIYCELYGQLFGIISTGDILRVHKGDTQVQVNKNFTYLHPGESMKARTIFKERESINALPVITKDYFLIGDYTRWDDLIVLDYELSLAQGSDFNSKGGIIALVQPSSILRKRQKIFEKCYKILRNQNVKVKIVDYFELSSNIQDLEMVLFVEENEIRACVTILEINFGVNFQGKDKTYRDVLGYDYFVNRQRMVYLKEIIGKGIKFLRLGFKESAYYCDLLKKINMKCATFGYQFSMWPESEQKNFFGDFYSEEYVQQILNFPIKLEYINGKWKLKDCQSQYFNVIEGERSTDCQPKDYSRSIYFFGPCYIAGRYVEDKNTIESYLQRNLCENKRKVRVVNYGYAGIGDFFSDIAVTSFKKGDIIILGQADIIVEDTCCIDLSQVLENNYVGTECMFDEIRHVNHKINRLFSDAIYEVIEPWLLEEVEGQGEIIKKNDNFIKYLYLDRYFKGIDKFRNKRIGSIVMNSNPFTYGHRYLIEKALHMVDLLIVFVVEEDRSIFSFSERFTMVQKGVEDLQNIMVVPSGPYILSHMSFPEYFGKETSNEMKEHTEQDIVTFAKCIAPQLGIKYRFAGEEPEDEVTNQYNIAMKKVLPQYGVEFIEIPRKKIATRNISASLARKSLEENDLNELKKLVPQTTRKILFGEDLENKNNESD